MRYACVCVRACVCACVVAHARADVQFDGAAGEEFEQQASQLCRQQSRALELIKSKQRKEPRFAHVVQVRTYVRACVCVSAGDGGRRALLDRVRPLQECEASRRCRRLQLRDLLVSEMQRLTKYPLLLDNVIKHTEGERSGSHATHTHTHTCIINE